MTQARLLKILAAKENLQPENLVQISALDRELSLLLSENDYALYEQLRESDREQSHVHAFAKEVLGTSPLTPQQQDELLLARLKHQRELQALDLQLTADRPDLAPMEASYVRDVATQGIRHYAQAFLADARSILTDQQWLALERFETSEAPELSHEH
jgi:hypothetical protein